MLTGIHLKGKLHVEDLSTFVENTHLEMVNKFKYLDIQMDSTRSCKDLISTLGKMVSSRIGMLRRAQKILLRSPCITRNNATILPLCDYFSCVWDSCGKLCKDYLDRLNRRVA